MAKAMNLYKESKKYFPGGVNSPVRSFSAVGLKPIFVKNAAGSKIVTAVGGRYIDYCMSWGALPFGHSDEDISRDVVRQLRRGTSYGFNNIYETELASLICEAIPSMQKLRFVNSGTEATISAARLARFYTGRAKILKFDGCYHGASELFLDKKNIVVAGYNDLESVESGIKEHRAEIACVIVEPVAGNMGVIPPSPGFLRGLREICSKYRIILIFDEVITGFRFGFSGAQKLFGVEPDLTCLGKIIGGGFPVGAYGGKKEIMDAVSPAGKFYQAGTFSGNPVTMAAGIGTLKKLKASAFGPLDEKSKYLCDAVESEARKKGLGVYVNRFGSIFSVHFAKNRPIDFRTVRKQDTTKFKSFYRSLFRGGVLLSPSPYESNFISFAHTDADIEKTIKAASVALRSCV